MGVPTMDVVNAGLAAALLGGGILLAIALWWSAAGDGIGIARARWPGPVLVAGLAGWGLWVGGLAAQVLGYFAIVGVARWP
jgi:hypothetical protein